MEKYDYGARLKNRAVREQLSWGNRAHEMDPRLREHLHNHPELYDQIEVRKESPKRYRHRSREY